MARKRRTSAVLEIARQRLAGLKTIKPAPDFGGDLSVAGGQAVITDCAGELDSYNQNTAALDEQQILVDTKEEATADWSKRLLSAGAAATALTARNTKHSAALVRANARNQRQKAPAAPSHQ